MPTLVCFGDSLISKEKENNGKRRLTSIIREEMSSWIVINSGVHGGTSRDGLARFQEDVLYHDPDVVSILFGTNDASLLKPVTINEFKTNLLYMVRRMSPERTILISPIPFYNEKREIGVNDSIEKYAIETKKIAEETGCLFIDLWKIAKNEKRLASDGFSIQKDGYKILANELMAKMQKVYLK